jgi:hypothetical protein
MGPSFVRELDNAGRLVVLYVLLLREGRLKTWVGVRDGKQGGTLCYFALLLVYLSLHALNGPNHRYSISSLKI